MTQEDVRRLLDELGGRATVEEVSNRAKKNFPKRSLHTYVGQLLQQLEKKGFVTLCEPNTWELTNKGKTTSLSGVDVSEVNTEVDRSTLNEYGLEVTNLVGTIQTDREFNLSVLTSALPDAEYHPESSPFLIYRPIESATLLVPANGLISVVGAKTVSQTKQAVRSFLEETNELGIEITVSPDEIVVQNVVISGDLNTELDLDALSIGIGLERCEYEPEQFSGLIYRSEHGPTVLLFRTGKYLITGAKSYAHAFQVAKGVHEELRMLGIDISNNIE
jgi:transcription initiation factor TFIID TATA-box-binding protein